MRTDPARRRLRLWFGEYFQIFIYVVLLIGMKVPTKIDWHSLSRNCNCLALFVKKWIGHPSRHEILSLNWEAVWMAAHPRCPGGLGRRRWRCGRRVGLQAGGCCPRGAPAPPAITKDIVRSLVRLCGSDRYVLCFWWRGRNRHHLSHRSSTNHPNPDLSSCFLSWVESPAQSQKASPSAYSSTASTHLQFANSP